MGDELVGPPPDIEIASPLMLKPAQHKNEHFRSKTTAMHKQKKSKLHHKNARIRSQTAPKPKVIFLDTLSSQTRRKRANHCYANSLQQPSLQCPTSPSIPEEDDILDIIHLDDDVSDQSTAGFSSDSDSASSNDEMTIIKRTESDDYDLDMRKRANSNSSITSNSCSSSSSSSSSDWDAEVREEEKAEALRLKNIKEPILLNRPMSDSDDDDDGMQQRRRPKSLILEQSNSSKLRDICENFEDDKVLVLSNNNQHRVRKNKRPKSTPFRSSKGTAMFLSNLKTHCVDHQFGGNLNELINGQKTAMIKSDKNKKQNVMYQRRRQRKIISHNLSDAIL